MSKSTMLQNIACMQKAKEDIQSVKLDHNRRKGEYLEVRVLYHAGTSEALKEVQVFQQ